MTRVAKGFGYVAIGLVVILGGLRGCGLQAGTPTVEVSIQGSGELYADSVKIAEHLATGVRRPTTPSSSSSM